MAYERTIKPEFWEDYKESTLPVPARLIHIVFWSISDKNNCIIYDIKKLKSEYPILDKIQISRYCKYLSKAGLIQFLSDNLLKIHPGKGLGLRRPYRMENYNVKAWMKLRGVVLKRDNYTCQYCGSNENLQADHIIPISKGGLDNLENLITACRKCNVRKKDLDVQVFKAKYNL
jgi:hypothetical protein